MTKKTIIKIDNSRIDKLYNLFEFLRIILVASGAFICNYLYNSNPQLLLHTLMPWVVLPIAGLTGIQGLFFSKISAEAHQREIGSIYQKQSAANNLAVAITALIVWLSNWGVYADAAILIATLIFLTLSSCIHTWEAIQLKHAIKRHLRRPIWTLALLLLCVPIIIRALT
jgi:hypothetical protein